eukprot:21458_1
MDINSNPLRNTQRSKYAPNFNSTRTLRSNNNSNNRQTYFGACNRYPNAKVYYNPRFDKAKKYSDSYRHKRKYGDTSFGQESNKENLSYIQVQHSRKKRKTNKHWGNKSKKPNPYRRKSTLRDHAKEKQFSENIHIINEKK